MQTALAAFVLVLLSAWWAQAIQADDGAGVDRDVLAAPERLQAIRDRCWDLSLELRQGTIEEESQGYTLTYECLVTAAVDEFRANLVSERMTVEKFEATVRRLSEERAQLVADINGKHGLCMRACDELASRLGGQVRIWAIEDYLNLLWDIYRWEEL